MTETTIRGSSHADLIAIPSLLLGFHPAESVVVLALRSGRVLFAARLDLGIPEGEARRATSQVLAAAEHMSGDGYVLVGYGRDVGLAAEGVETVRDLLGDGVLTVLVCGGARYWEFARARLVPPGGLEYDFRRSTVAAQAVYEGMRVAGSRAEAVAEVQPPPAGELADVAVRLDEAATRTAALAPDERPGLLRQLLEASEPLPPDDAADLACLIQDDELIAEVLARLCRENARQVRNRLVDARRNVAGEFEASVLGLLGLACWLAGEGAEQTDCMVQLEEMAPHHLLLGMLEALHSGGVPPSQWDQWLHGETGH